jgi:hypothetical protein
VIFGNNQSITAILTIEASEAGTVLEKCFRFNAAVIVGRLLLIGPN